LVLPRIPFTKQLEEHGLTSKIVHLSDAGLKLLISQYTREAGVRNLEREIANLCRKVAKRLAEGKDKKFEITDKNLHVFSGLPNFCLKKKWHMMR